MPVDSGHMIFTTATIHGFWLSQWLRTAAPERLQSVTADLLRLMATNEIVPPVEAEYPLNDVLAAVEHSERPGRSGKVLLVG
jgi:NADPH:quinone reductase-like Zn-dependent oxidoreductase